MFRERNERRKKKKAFDKKMAQDLRNLTELVKRMKKDDGKIHVLLEELERLRLEVVRHNWDLQGLDVIGG